MQLSMMVHHGARFVKGWGEGSEGGLRWSKRTAVTGPLDEHTRKCCPIHTAPTGTQSGERGTNCNRGEDGGRECAVCHAAAGFGLSGGPDEASKPDPFMRPLISRGPSHCPTAWFP